MQETSVYNVKLFKISVIKILGEGVRSKKECAKDGTGATKSYR